MYISNWIRLSIVNYVHKNSNNQHCVFRDDYLKYINRSAITKIIQNSLNRSITTDIYDLNLNINYC